MMTLEIQDEELVKRLRALASQQNRPVEAVLRTLLDHYTQQNTALAAMDGMFDDDIADLSTTVRETMTQYYQQRDGRTD